MFLAIALMAAATSTTPSEVNPMRAVQGEGLQCYSPIMERKTCRALASYRPNGAGRYLNRAEIPLRPHTSMTMTTVTPVRIVAGAICGTVTQDDVARAEIRTAGTPMAPAQAAALLEQIAREMRRIIGHEVCTRYERNGDVFVAKVSIDGTYDPDFDQRVIWVRASDGYHPGP
jgi:hypothetical protein